LFFSALYFFFVIYFSDWLCYFYFFLCYFSGLSAQVSLELGLGFNL
jgi:hypothetical protein